jgi:hypothetical protein
MPTYWLSLVELANFSFRTSAALCIAALLALESAIEVEILVCTSDASCILVDNAARGARQRTIAYNLNLRLTAYKNKPLVFKEGEFCCR